MARRRKLTEGELQAAVLQQIHDAEGYETDELAHMREKALDYYYNRKNIAPSLAGRSEIQSSDVADMVEAVIAQMMPAFETESVVEFEAMSEDDVEQARLETDAVNYVVMQASNGYYELQTAIRDALLMRNGLVKVYLDEKVEVRTDNYNMLTLQELGSLQMGALDSIDYVDNGYTVDVIDDDDVFFNVVVKTKETKRKVLAKAIDPTNFSWERDHDCIYLDDVRFCCERSLPTRGELIDMGYDARKVNRLNAGGNDTQLDSIARNQHSSRRNWRGSTPAEDVIEFFECYYRCDRNGDGVAELLKICIANKVLLTVEEADMVPYASGTAFLQPHRFNGLGLFDKLEYVQMGKTHSLRQWADNLNHTNNTRLGVVDGMVNLDDVVNSRPGGIVRMGAPDAIIPLDVKDVGPSAAGFLEYMDKTRSERGGASLDLQSAEMQIAGDTAHGVERQMSSKEQAAAMMCRTLAETLVRKTYQLVHEALRMYVPDDMTFKVGERFQSANPGDWQKRESLIVKAGLSVGERMRKQAALEKVIALHGQMKQNGEYVSADDSYNAQLDWCRCQGIDSPERYFTDPQSEEAQQAAQQAQAQAEQASQYQMMLVELQKQVEDRAADNADAKVMEDARQFNEELQFKYTELQVNSGQKTADQMIQLMGTDDGEQGGAGAAAGSNGATRRAAS